MKLSIKLYPEFDAKQQEIMEELSYHTTKLYNIANYECRENSFKNYITLEKMLRSNWHKEFMHSHTYQHCLKMVEQNWKSYMKAMKDYKKNPHKYKGEPRAPRYKHIEKQKNEVIFTNLAIRREKRNILLSLSMKMQVLFGVDSLKVGIPKRFPLPKQATMQQVRIQYDKTRKQWYLLIIYKVVERERVSSDKFMSIDIGLDNLAAITFSHGPVSYLVCGKSLKAVNGYIGKEIARLESIRMKQVGSDKFKNTKRINRLWEKRHHYMNNYFHKASRWIVELANSKKIGTIVIGDMKGIKQGNNSKTFVQVPVQRLVQLITYKAELLGIQVILQKESYTSGVSAIDLEPIEKAFYDKSRRVQRGSFMATHMTINADINGSLNIMRKYMGKGTPRLINLARDNGFVNNPQRIRVA